MIRIPNLQMITLIHAIFTLPHVLNVFGTTAETMSKTGTIPFFSKLFFPIRRKQAVKSSQGSHFLPTIAWAIKKKYSNDP